MVLIFGIGTATAQKPLGIDVSDYQGTGITWSSVKGAGITFAWSKATEGTGGAQSSFVGNENNGKAAGIYMGAYHYAHPELNTPASEAANFWSVAGSYIKADGLTLMPMLDIEGDAFDGNVGASSLSDWINQWCTDVLQDAANNGVSIKPAIYISACNASHLNSTVSQWYSDIANYGAVNGGNDPQGGTPWSSCSGDDVWGSGVWHFWQYESVGTIAGISGNVDHDVYNGTPTALFANMVATASTNSAIFYWDPQGTTGANPYTSSMTGTWENSKWSYGSAGLATPVGWVDGKAVCFGVHTGIGTPAYTITMNSSHVVAGFFDGALTPKACDVTIQGSGTINLASGAQALDSKIGSDGSIANLRINVPIDGNGQLFPEGTGNSYLNATNTYTGGTQLGYSTVPFSGNVYFNNGSAFGTGTITLWNEGNGGWLLLEGAAAVTVPNAVTVTTAVTNNIAGNPAGLTFSGNWSLGANLLTLGTGTNAANQTIVSGVVSGSAGLLTYNLGTLVLSGVNTYTGTTTINSPAVLTIGGAGQLGSGTYTGSIVNNGTFNFNSTAAQTLSGVISGTGPLKTLNAGTLVLTGVNTYSGGTTAGAGSTLCLTADSGLGAASAGLTLNGGCLKNNNSSPTLGSGRTITLGASGGYFDAGWAPTHPVTISSKLSGSGSLLINLDGSPVVLANTANAYTGNTIIGTNGPGYLSSGTQAWLKLGASGVIPNGSGKGNVFINQAYLGLLDLAGFSQALNGLSGDGTVDNSTGNGSLSVGNNNQSSTFSGVIQNTVGTLALTKAGSGTLTLAGPNSYTGSTTISAGTLALGNGGSTGASTVTVASTATLANATTNTGTIGGPATFNSGAFGSFVAVGGVPSTVGKISVTGNLALNANVLVISVSGPALAVGTYRLLDCTGTLSGSANTSPALSGTPLAAGYTAVVSTTPGAAGHVDLVVQATPVFSNLTLSQSVTYGTTTVLLGGTVSAPGPLYPASGETVMVTINGNAQPTTINDLTGDFSISYNLAGIPASGGAYSISYTYGGDAILNSAADSSTALTINPRPVVLAGTRPYDGTATAAAAILSVTNAVGGDVVTVASGSATLAGTNAGAQAISSVGTLTLGGPAATNYTLSGASGSVTVSPLAVMLAGTRPYDGTATATAAILSVTNAVGADVVNLASGSGALAGTNAGVQAISSFGTLALGGAAAPNYTLTGASGSVTVNPLPVILTGTRPYDGTTTATAAILSVTNVVGGDVVTVASGTATLAAADAGTEAISSFGTLALGGAAMADYTLTGASGSVIITANGFMITGEYIDGTGTNFVITWQSTPGTNYQVLASTNASLPLNTWVNVGSPITASNATTTITIPITSDSSFFEVKSQ